MVSDAFLAPVVTRVIAMAELYELDDPTDPNNSGKSLKDTDPVILGWAHTVYGIAKAYCGRPFESGTFTDLYKAVEERVLLRVTPISSITSVRIIGNTEDMAGTDYSLDVNTLILETAIRSSYSGDEYFNPPRDLKVVYVGGYDTADENEELLSALSAQTFLWYQARDILGKKIIKTKDVSSEVASTKFELAASVKATLEEGGLVYSDVGYQC